MSKGQIHECTVTCKYCHTEFEAQSERKEVCWDCQKEQNRQRAYDYKYKKKK